MNEEVLIQPAARGDVDAIHRIEEDSFPAPWRREFFFSELAADGRYNRVAKRDGRVVGYLFAMWIFDELHVNKIAVAPTERRRGIADKLMAQCIGFAGTHHVRTISLEVRKSNQGAQDFYRHLGFASSYVRPRYYPDGEAAVVMTLEV